MARNVVGAQPQPAPMPAVPRATSAMIAPGGHLAVSTTAGSGIGSGSAPATVAASAMITPSAPNISVLRASEHTNSQFWTHPTTSPKVTPLSFGPLHRYAESGEAGGGGDKAAGIQQPPVLMQTHRGMPPVSAGAVRATGSQQAVSPTRQLHPAEAVGECLHLDCPTCADTRRRGFVLCRLTCGHVVRAQIVEDAFPVHAAWAGPNTHRAESPSPMHTVALGREQATSPGPRGHAVMRQVSGARPVPSVSMAATYHAQNTSAMLSPVGRGPTSPASPTQTQMYRKMPSLSTSFSSSREATGLSEAQGTQADQPRTSRGGSSGSGPGSATIGAPVGGGSRENLVEKARRHTEASALRQEATMDGRLEAAQARKRLDIHNTVAECITDVRGDVLHTMCNVILLQPPSSQDNREQQLKVRGQIVGTYWDHQKEVAPPLEHPGEVQVLITYVDSSERHVPLIFPTKYAQTFGDTETAEYNIIKWKASLCKVGKKFS